MKVVKPGLSSRPTLLGAVGAIALLTMAATATFAAGLPNVLPAADPTATASASATAGDRDDSASASATATATGEANETASDEASERPATKASGSPLIGYCHALNGNALQAISEVVKNKGDKDLPPGLKKVYERLVACPSFTAPGGKPTAAPTDEPTEQPSGEPVANPSLPTPTVADGDRVVPSVPAGGGHGRGNGH